MSFFSTTPTLVIVYLATTIVSFVLADNARPVIGILTQPVESSLAPFGSSYIAASYVKYVESGGARAVPVFHNGSASYLATVYSQIDGILFPGGGADISPNTALFKAASYFLWRAVKEATTSPFVVMGHCQGFELINAIVSANPHILSAFDSENLTLPLNFTASAPHSRMFGAAPASVYASLAGAPVTFNAHAYGVKPTAYQANSPLGTFFNVLSLNNDRVGHTFVSSIEARDPAVEIYAIQWHPEKPQFEWNPTLVINHSAESIAANAYMQRFLVDRARRSTHKLTDAGLLIYNYVDNIVYTGPSIMPTFEQCYVF
jgi:gamma-glutamyl hydrolase